MAKVLVLFASSDELESKRLKDLVQAKLGTSYDLTTNKGILAEDGDPSEELSRSSCVLLISTKQSTELIKQKQAEKEGEFVIFDGALIQEHIDNKNLMTKLIVVQLGNDSGDYVPGGFHVKKFAVGENFNAQTAVLDDIVDAIKGIVGSKVNDKCAKKEKTKKCSQM